jgi:hypothetical protein
MPRLLYLGLFVMSPAGSHHLALAPQSSAKKKQNNFDITVNYITLTVNFEVQ